ncbi:unnamed protein product [Didymodactylos carnosus]|uniref:EF-hand domain-containing protein n=1 Tax=Didymodactylos carnosus TaxID=1234261 RepID=A0A813R743_9BILA|nr:unnamed protein product [Didymodactylos carnosus]CAF1168870.1 unnamed protein product [Didymodactylos carnosus]CAF3562242.1 unnamed protein product [Didymodactylos carnosus]CAF3980350.1 unnamed protein product [Didymodactylos carnosus]
MADELSESQLAEMEQAFFSIDKDNSTEISIEELEIVMQSLGLNPTATELRLMISEVDADDSGTIDFPEFVTMLAVRMKDTANEHRIKEIFQLFDKDEDGQISHNELNVN